MLVPDDLVERLRVRARGLTCVYYDLQHVMSLTLKKVKISVDSTAAFI